MRAGRLKHRIEFQKQERTPDGLGGASVTWVTFATARAALRHQRGNEELQHDQIQSPASVIFDIRPRTDLQEGHRIIYNGRAYNIRYIPDLEPRTRLLSIEAERGVAT